MKSIKISSRKESCPLCMENELNFLDWTKEQKMEWLIALSKIKRNCNGSYEYRRAKKHKSDGNCFVCGNIANFKHHIIALKNNGTNKRKNLVNICNSCHEEVHPWLKKC